MSLFGDAAYQYRETFFVLFHSRQQPSPDALRRAVEELGSRYELAELRLVDGRIFESLTVLCPLDNAGMDVTLVQGEEVKAQVRQLQEELRTTSLSAEDLAKLGRLRAFDSRFDVFHFEQLALDAEEETYDDDEFLDPGGVLVVLEQLARLTEGVVLDPQSQTLL